MNRRWFDLRSAMTRRAAFRRSPCRARRGRSLAWLAPLSLALTVMPGSPAAAEAPDELSPPAERALHDIYRLNADGVATDLTLQGIDWHPGGEALLLHGVAPHHFPLLAPRPDNSTLALGAIATDGARSALLGANPLHDLTRSHLSGGTADTETEIWFENVLGWLLDSDMPFHPGARSLKIVLADLNGLEAGAPDAITRRWFEHRSPAIELTDPWRCDGARLLECLDGADLVVLGPGGTLGGAGGDVARVESRMRDEEGARRALAATRDAGIPLLYLHEPSRGGDDPRATLAAFGVETRVGSDDAVVAYGGVPLIDADDPAPTLAAALPVGRR